MQTIEEEAEIAPINAPSLFIDGFHGMAVINGMARLNLHEDRYNPISGKTERHIVTRLVFPVAGLAGFIEGLQKANESISSSILTENKE